MNQETANYIMQVKIIEIYNDVINEIRGESND